jgi:release factor glutamine methyltransferase
MISIDKSYIKAISNVYSITEKEALTLLSDIVNVDYTKLFFEDIYNLEELQLETFLKYVKRRGASEPISKILEKKEFYGNVFKTNRYTLDPRPETELLIDLFQIYFKDKNQDISILDLGSGTGCIGFSILSIYKNARCEFVDVSRETLDVSFENANTLDLQDRCKFTLSNWFENVHGKYDAIVTNPPYISTSHVLSNEVLYDPDIALYAGEDGMDTFNEIIPNSVHYLKGDGKLITEIGFDQKDKIMEMSCIQTPDSMLKILQIAQDHAGHGRAVVFERC